MTAREFVTCLYLMAASAKLTPRKPKQHRYVGGLIDTAGGVAGAVLASSSGTGFRLATSLTVRNDLLMDDHSRS
jgi:hypothetical protein